MTAFWRRGKKGLRRGGHRSGRGRYEDRRGRVSVPVVRSHVRGRRQIEGLAANRLRLDGGRRGRYCGASRALLAVFAVFEVLVPIVAAIDVEEP